MHFKTTGMQSIMVMSATPAEFNSLSSAIKLETERKCYRYITFQLGWMMTNKHLQVIPTNQWDFKAMLECN